jgi:hypothetical protein
MFALFLPFSDFEFPLDFVHRISMPDCGDGLIYSAEFDASVRAIRQRRGRHAFIARPGLPRTPLSDRALHSRQLESYLSRPPPHLETCNQTIEVRRLPPPR